MAAMLQATELATGDLRLLAYMYQMAQTAQPAAAKRVFALFAQQERRRIDANGGFQLSASWHGVVGAQSPPASVSAGGPVRLTRSGSMAQRSSRQAIGAGKAGTHA